MKLVVYLMAAFSSTIGVLLGLFIYNEIIDIQALADLLNLSFIQAENLLWALLWYLVCFIAFIMATKIDYHGFSLISIDFLLTWIFCNIGVILGSYLYILIDTGSLTINWDAILDNFYLFLATTLGPAGTTAMGLKNKN